MENVLWLKVSAFRKEAEAVEKTGNLVTALTLVEEEDIMIITEKGVVIRQNTESISLIGRNTQGVKLIRLDADDKVADVAKVVVTENGKDEEDVEE